MTPRRKRRAAVEHRDVVQTQESALEDVAAVHILAIDPPREIQHEVIERAAQEIDVPVALSTLLHQIIEHRGERMYRRIHVAEIPPVGGKPAVGGKGCWSSRLSWSGEKVKSTRLSVMLWKARSQAAYQGYSHLSGIEMMSSLFMWSHSWLRTFLPLRGAPAVTPRLRSQSATG